MKRQSPWEQEEAEEHGEEPWLISYADMVTLLFGFFVILYSFSTVDDKKFDQLSAKVAESFKAPISSTKKAEADFGLENETRQIRALQMLVAMLNLGDNVPDAVKRVESVYQQHNTSTAVKDLLQDRLSPEKSKLIEELKDSGETSDDIVELVLPDTALFRSGGFTLTPESESELRQLAGQIRQADGIVEVAVVGYTDSQPPSSRTLFKDNFTLSSLRAGAVASALISGGLREDVISVRGMGSLRPRVPERDANGSIITANLAKNRRVQIVLKKKKHDAR